MNIEVFVQNVKHYCSLKGVKPTVACEESGAGKNLLSQMIHRGSLPTVARVQLLAQYLGCTVSDLLGETSGQVAPALDPLTAEAARIFAALLPENQGKAIAFLLRLQRSEKR